MHPPHEILSSSFFHTPCVYGWRRDQEYLYIGKALSVLKRFNAHHVIDEFEEFLRHDKLDVWFFDSAREASAYESKMIKEHRPIYNTQLTSGSVVERRRNKRTRFNIDLPKQT